MHSVTFSITGSLKVQRSEVLTLAQFKVSIWVHCPFVEVAQICVNLIRPDVGFLASRRMLL